MTLHERAQQMQELLRVALPYLPLHLTQQAIQCLEPLPSPDSPPTAGKYPPGFVHDPAHGDVVTDAGKSRDVGGHPIKGTL